MLTYFKVYFKSKAVTDLSCVIGVLTHACLVLLDEPDSYLSQSCECFDSDLSWSPLCFDLNLSLSDFDWE